MEGGEGLRFVMLACWSDCEGGSGPERDGAAERWSAIDEMYQDGDNACRYCVRRRTFVLCTTESTTKGLIWSSRSSIMVAATWQGERTTRRSGILRIRTRGRRLGRKIDRRRRTL